MFGQIWCYVVGELEPADITDFDLPETDVPVQLEELFRDVLYFRSFSIGISR